MGQDILKILITDSSLTVTGQAPRQRSCMRQAIQELFPSGLRRTASFKRGESMALLYRASSCIQISMTNFLFCAIFAPC